MTVRSQFTMFLRHMWLLRMPSHLHTMTTMGALKSRRSAQIVQLLPWPGVGSHHLSGISRPPHTSQSKFVDHVKLPIHCVHQSHFGGNRMEVHCSFFARIQI